MAGVRRRDGARGFTLIELLAVMVIFGVLLAIALPSFDVTLKRYRAGMAATQIAGALQFARTEAIRTGGNITVGQAGPSAECTPGEGDATDWHCGVNVAANGTLLKTIAASSLNALSVRLNTNPKTARSAITFSSLGYTTCGTCTGGMEPSDSFIHIWPAADGGNPATSSAVSTVCATRAGKVVAVALYVTDVVNCVQP